MTLAVGYLGVWAVWLYPANYVGLPITRQADDDKVSTHHSDSANGRSVTITNTGTRR
ncbi:MAG: hypothetical protein JW722_06495 [Demequinaceae bacterium]|nr:hypothetical protein [Demequinaceae bacterium]